MEQDIKDGLGELYSGVESAVDKAFLLGVRHGKRGEEGEPLIDNMPVYLNLSMDLESFLGRCRAIKNEDGTMQLVIDFHADAAQQLANLAEIFELKGLTFAGVKRPERPERIVMLTRHRSAYPHEVFRDADIVIDCFGHYLKLRGGSIDQEVAQGHLDRAERV